MGAGDEMLTSRATLIWNDTNDLICTSSPRMALTFILEISLDRAVNRCGSKCIGGNP